MTDGSKRNLKVMTVYAESVPDAHMVVQGLTEKGAEVISVCPIPDAEVLRFAIFSRFDPDTVDEDDLWKQTVDEVRK